MLFELVTDPPDKVIQYLRACSRSRAMVLGSLTFLTKDGQTCLCRCEGAVIQPWSPESTALIFLRLKTRESASSRFILLNKKIDQLAKEIRERQRAEEERTQLLVREQLARAEAERLNRLKDEFLSTLSHELRTPLNAILGWSQILRARRTDEKIMHHALETIERNARSQVQLIDDLLDVSRIIMGKIRLNVHAVELLPVIESAMDTVRPAADAKNIRLQLVLDPAAGPVLGDSERLQQIVWNLLSNAIKFTPKGGRVQVGLKRINSHVEIVVTDTGQGISAEFLPYVFDRFRQADSSITRSFSGLGLGLAIVRQLVELHGGTVHAESLGEGQGATFTVKLPLMAVSPKPSGLEQVHPTIGGSVPFDCSPSLNGLRILVVDDEADTRALLIYALEASGAEVVAAASADEAISALTKSLIPMDVLISDIGMPDEDGYTLLRRVRALEKEQGGKIPAVALTAYARTEDRRAALLAGFQFHIAKPVEPGELIAVIANLTGRTGGV
jgi:signal transduction histidine kinase/ActR/RegA family two-component response regulator